MKLFLAISLLFNYACVCQRSFFSSDMCSEQETNDCSFQFPYADTGECVIFNTEACKSYEFSSWNLEPFTEPSSESDLPLNISVIPYAFLPETFKDNPNLNLSAVNITMFLLHKGIKGFSFIMIRELHPNVCRIFDFRNYTHVLQTSAMLYYDCFYKLVEGGFKNVTLTFRIYPQNIQATYLVSIPDAPLAYYDSPCSWKPLVMIFEGGLQTYYIQIKFSNAPDNFAILFYVVTLLDINNRNVKSVRIPANSGANMLSTEFVSVEEGFFSISISIVDVNKTSCVVSQTRSFFVGYQTKDYSIVTFSVLVTVLFIFVCGLLYITFHRHCTTVKPPFLKLLFVYSFDCPQHKEFLLAYIKFMEDNYGVKINTIYGNYGSPNAWIEDKYFDSNVIVFVISEGLYHIFERNNIPPLVEEDHWDGQLLVAGKFISEEKFVRTYSDDKNERIKKFCKISFPYSGKQHVPKFLKRKGNLFMLPKDEDKFLCFIFGCSKFMSCKSHHKKKFVNVQHIKEKLEDMQETASKNMHISFKKTKVKGNTSETIESLHKSAAYEKNHQCSSGDFLKSVFEEKCQENIELSAQKSNCTDLKNEDPVRYLMHNEFDKK